MWKKIEQIKSSSLNWWRLQYFNFTNFTKPHGHVNSPTEPLPWFWRTNGRHWSSTLISLWLLPLCLRSYMSSWLQLPTDKQTKAPDSKDTSHWTAGTLAQECLWLPIISNSRYSHSWLLHLPWPFPCIKFCLI